METNAFPTIKKPIQKKKPIPSEFKNLVIIEFCHNYIRQLYTAVAKCVGKVECAHGLRGISTVAWLHDTWASWQD